MKKIFVALGITLQLIAISSFAQTTKVQNLQVLGTSSFAGAATFTLRPTFNGATPYDSSNLTIANYATLASPTFTGTPVVPGYLTTSAASSTYATLSGPTFTGVVTIPSGAVIAGYLTTATAASTYAPLASPTFSGTATASSFSGAGTGLTGTAASLSIGGTASKATGIAGGGSSQIAYNTAANTTSFIAAPTVASTYLQWTGSAYTWAAGGGGGGGSGTVTSVAASGGSTGLTFTGSPVTTTGTLTLGGTLAPANGGLGTVTNTAHGLMIGEGASNVATTAAGAVGYSLVGQGAADPKWAQLSLVLTGADPTGATDSTTAIQNFANSVVTHGYEGIVPPGNYKISAAISLPFGWGWKIHGASMQGTTITQFTNNTPIWKFATGANGGGSPDDTGDYSWAINDMTLAWNTAQSTSNTSSVGVFFTNSNETYFDWQISRLNFQNAYRGIALDSAAEATVWGCSIRDIVYGSTNSGSAINFESTNAGQPNISVDGVYITATNIAQAEDLVGVFNNDSSWFNHIEVNGATNGNLVLNMTGQGAIGAVKVEVGTWTAGQFVYRFANAHFSIGVLTIDAATIAASGGAAYGIDANAGGATTTLSIGQMYMNFASITGNFYLVNGGTAPAYSVRFLSAPQGLLGVTGAYLTQVPAAVGADGISVDDWQQPRIAADAGNANASWSIGNPNIILYNTPLTATRTVTLLDADNDTDTNLYNGVKVCVLRTGNATGTSLQINVKNAEGVTLGFLPATASTFGKICFMWQRALGIWTVTDYQTWTSLHP